MQNYHESAAVSCSCFGDRHTQITGLYVPNTMQNIVFGNFFPQGGPNIDPNIL